MDLEKLRKELEADEGRIDEIYTDHLGYPTFGIGHLVVEGDPEYGKEIGTYVPEYRVIKAFKQDIKTVLSDCNWLYEDFEDLPEEAQRVIANMMFNMGYTRLSYQNWCRINVYRNYVFCTCIVSIYIFWF
jgi:GH24 family phage-related lysozyme (muramidase)